MLENLKRAIDRRLNPGDDDDKLVDTLIIILIAFNVLAVMLETEPQLHEDYKTWFFAFEAFSTVVFSLEYMLRIWCAR